MQHHTVHNLQRNRQLEMDRGLRAPSPGDGIGPDLLRSPNLEAGGGADLIENPAWFRPERGPTSGGFY